MQVTLHRLSRLYSGGYLYKHICIHAITIREKRGYEFEGEWEKYTGGFGERKEKGEMF